MDLPRVRVQKLLHSLDLQFEVIPSGVDEEQIKNEGHIPTFTELAKTLAAAKALFVSQNYPHHFVIAADQLCVFEGQYFDKPGTHANAINQLRKLSGKTHQQIAATCIAKAGQIIWQSQETATLTMRDISDYTIEIYLQLDSVDLCQKTCRKFWRQ